MDYFENMDRIVCRYFVSRSGCKFGRRCYFPHIIGRDRKPDTICRFFLGNKCIFGNRCWHLHKNIPLQSGNSFSETNAEENQGSGLNFNSAENNVCRNQNGHFILYNIDPIVFNERFSNINGDAFDNFMFSFSCVKSTTSVEAVSLYPHSSDLYYFYEILPACSYEYVYNGTPQPYLNSNLQHETILCSGPVSEETSENPVTQDTHGFSSSNNYCKPEYYAFADSIYATSSSIIEDELSIENSGVCNSQNKSESKLLDNYKKNLISSSSKEEENYSLENSFNPDDYLLDCFQNSNETWNSGIKKKLEDIPEEQINENITRCMNNSLEVSFSNNLLSYGNGLNKAYQETPDMDYMQMKENMPECLNNHPEICILNNFQNINNTCSNGINEEYETVKEISQIQINKNNAGFSNNFLELSRENCFINIIGSWGNFTNNKYEEIVPLQLGRSENKVLNNHVPEVSFPNYFQNFNGSTDSELNKVCENVPLMYFAKTNENESVFSNNSIAYSSQLCFKSNYESPFYSSKSQPEFVSSDFRKSVSNFDSKNNFQKSKQSRSFQSNTFLRRTNYKQIKKYDVSNKKYHQSKMCRNFGANGNTKNFRAKFCKNNDKNANHNNMIDSRRKLKDRVFTDEIILKTSENCNLPKQCQRFSYLEEIKNAKLHSQMFSVPYIANGHVSIGEKIELGLSDKKCLMCLQNITNTFAILENCDHTFCLKCIYWWRSVQNNRKNFANCAAACPVCKNISTCVVPSRTWIECAAEKDNVIKRYKSLLKQIHCKYFNRGKGFCVYGNSCIYLHEYRKK